MSVSRAVLSVTTVLAVLAEFGAAAAQDGEMAWTHSRYPADDRGEASSSLVFGIPETDAVQFVALCGPGSGGAQVEIGADIGEATEDSPVDIRFGGPSMDRMLRGTVVGTTREEGIVGVRLLLPPDDPLWQALSAGPALVYGVPGGQQAELPLAGSSMPVSLFLEDCSTYAAAGGPGSAAPEETGVAAGPTPSSDDAGALPDRVAACASEGALRSANGAAVEVTFVNRSDGQRGVLWIDYDGQAQQYAMLAPGESYAVGTYVGHPWMFTDGPGNCLEVYMPDPAESVFEITVPNRNFGDE